PGAAGVSSLKFFLSDDPILDALDLELTPALQTTGLTPGASWSTAPMLTIPASVGTGTKFLFVRADVRDQIDADVSNNTAMVPIEIGDFIDLQITAVSGPAFAGTGRPMTASFSVRNAGTAPAGPFRVSLFLGPSGSATPGEGMALGFKDVARLATGSSLTTTAVLAVPVD